MKVFLSLSLLVALTLAEPPRYRQQYQSERNQYYFARQQQEAETPAEAESAAPYPASGWKPDGPSFELPQRQQQQNAAPTTPRKQYSPQTAPQQQYGAPAAPQQQYGAPAAPQQQYGAPAAPQQQYGAPAAPQQQYGAAAAPQQQYRAPAAPQQQYRAPATAQRQYAAPAASQQQYGAPAAPQQQYGAPAAPQQQYGAPATPQQQYGAPASPQQSYGAPDGVTTTEEPNSPDFEDSTTLPVATEPQAEPVDSVNELDEEGDVDEQQRQSGEYYVALPDGRLQRVQYMSSQDIEAMKYFAKIRAENVEPLRGPIYAYAPLQKLEFAPARLQVAIDPYTAAAPVVAIRENAPNASGKNAKAAPEKLQQSQQQRQPLAAEVQYETPAAIVGLTGAPAAPVSSSYTTYTANYQVPTNEQRYIVTF